MNPEAPYHDPPAPPSRELVDKARMLLGVGRPVDNIIAVLGLTGYDQLHVLAPDLLPKCQLTLAAASDAPPPEPIPCDDPAVAELVGMLITTIDPDLVQICSSILYSKGYRRISFNGPDGRIGTLSLSVPLGLVKPRKRGRRAKPVLPTLPPLPLALAPGGAAEP